MSAVEQAIARTDVRMEPGFAGGPEASVGQRLRALRVARGISQRELSSPGVSYAYISRIEAGTRNPSVKALRQLAPKIGVSVEYLETGEHPAWWLGLYEGGVDPSSLTEDELAHVLDAADKSAFRAGRGLSRAILEARRAAEIRDLEEDLRIRREQLVEMRKSRKVVRLP